MTSRTGPLAVSALAALALLFAYAFMKTGLFIAILTAIGLTLFYYSLSPSSLRTIGYRPAVVAILMPLAAWGIPNMWLLYAAMLMLVPLCARKPGEVAPLYIFSLLLLPGLDWTISLGSLKLFEFGVHDALAVGGTIRLLHFGRKDGIRKLDLPVIALLLLLVAATARDTSITNFIRVLVNYCLDLALPYYIVSRSVRTMDDVRLCMVWLCCAATILSVLLLYEVHKSWPMYNVLYDRYGIPALLLVKNRGGVMRAGGPFLESTSMAMVLVFCFFAAWRSRSAFRSKYHQLGILLILLAGLWAPQSRGAWVGLFVGMMVADIYAGRFAPMMRRLSLVTAVGVVLVGLAQISPYVSEAVGLSGGSVHTVDYRERLFERGIEEFRKSPLTGHSLPEVMARLEDMRQGEGIIDFVNTYVFIALVSGIIGLFIFVGAFVTCIGTLLARHSNIGRIPDDIGPASFVCAGLVTAMEMLFFTSFGGRCAVFVFLFFAFSVAIAGMRYPAGNRKMSPPAVLTYTAATRH